MRAPIAVLSVLLVAFAGCGSDEGEADRLGVAAECTEASECDEAGGQICLAQFKGGYCGISGCVSDEDCPVDAACIAHDDGSNYCFRTCLDKVECNANRGADNEANCSASVTFTDGDMGRKACVPPSA